jgi:hypothetical protein
MNLSRRQWEINMSDNPVLDFLASQSAQLNRRLDTPDRKLDEVITRLSALERDGAALKETVRRMCGSPTVASIYWAEG